MNTTDSSTDQATTTPTATATAAATTTDDDDAQMGPLVQVTDLTKHFPVKDSLLDSVLGRGGKQAVRAVDGVSFEIARGEVFGLIGESGSGKSTVGRLVIRLLDVTAGTAHFDGTDLGTLRSAELRTMRRQMQMIFQDPLASLNPRMTIGEAIEHPAKIHLGDLSPAERRDRVLAMLTQVGMNPAHIFYDKYPHQLSGGQRQRVAIARALVTHPALVVADEPVAMADVSVRAVLLDLMMQLKDDLDLTYLFITHDLASAKYVCDRIAVMYLGEIVEIGPLADVYKNPQHPYTQALLDAVPVPDPRRRRTHALPRGEIPNPINPPSGCRFHPRCPIAHEGICDGAVPPLLPAIDRTGSPVEHGDPAPASDHLAACHLRTGNYRHLA